MSQSNKLWTIALILVVLTLLGSSIVEAGIFDSIKNSATNTWNKVAPYVKEKVFWINVVLITVALFIIVQFYEPLRARFEGAGSWMRYLLLLVLAIVIAAQLKGLLIYKANYVKWLLHPNIIINVVVIYAIIYLIMTLFPSIFGNVIGNLRQNRILNFIVILLISLVIVYNVSKVNLDGVPENKALIWHSKFWISIEEKAFGEREDGKFGKWTGRYDSDTKYGFLSWHKEPLLTGTASVVIRGTTVTLPIVPPILIFFLSYLLIRASLGWFLGRTGLSENIQRLLCIYLAIVVTTNGMTLANLALYIRMYLFIVFLRALEGIDLRAISRFVIAWILSGAIMGLVLQPGTAPSLRWIWTILSYEALFVIWPIIQGIYHIIAALANAIPGPKWLKLIGGIIGGGVLAFSTDDLTKLLKPILVDIPRQIENLLRPIFENLGIAVPGVGELKNATGISASITGLLLLGLINIIIVKQPPNLGAIIVGLLLGAIAGRMLWTSRVRGVFRDKFAEKIGRDAVENWKSEKKLTKEDPVREALIEELKKRAWQGKAGDTEYAIIKSNSEDELKRRLGDYQYQRFNMPHTRRR